MWDEKVMQGTAGRTATIHAAAEERLAFVRRVYSIFFGSLLVAGFGVYEALTNDAVMRFAFGLLRTHWLLYIGIVFGSVWVVQALSLKPTINIIAFYAFALFFGIVTAPLVYMAAQQTGGFEVVWHAAALTVLVFGGLTVYAFTTRRDFTLWGSMLFTGLIVAFGFSMLGIFFGFAGNPGLSLLWILLISGYVLYDTQMILRRYSPEQAIPAAMALFIDFLVLFQRILFLFMRRR